MCQPSDATTHITLCLHNALVNNTTSDQSNLAYSCIAATHLPVHCSYSSQWASTFLVKVLFSRGDVDPHLIHGLLGLHESALWMASWSIQPFLHSLPVCPRHKPCYVWLAGKICALVQTMQLSNNQIETVMIALCTCVKLCEKVTFNCSCVSGYVGRYCEHLLDLCNGSDCRHNATCIPLYDSLSYRCLCSPGQSHC